MKTYHIEFTGHWPVGAVASVRANSKEEALKLVEAELEKNGLPQKLKIEDLHETPDNTVVIILDGDY